jgi:hypothetical protein
MRRKTLFFTLPAREWMERPAPVQEALRAALAEVEGKARGNRLDPTRVLERLIREVRAHPRAGLFAMDARATPCRGRATTTWVLCGWYRHGGILHLRLVLHRERGGRLPRFTFREDPYHRWWCAPERTARVLTRLAARTARRLQALGLPVPTRGLDYYLGPVTWWEAQARVAVIRLLNDEATPTFEVLVVTPFGARKGWSYRSRQDLVPCLRLALNLPEAVVTRLVAGEMDAAELAAEMVATRLQDV